MNNQNINPKSLKGKEVFNRALELMNKLTPINESVINASLEFVKRAPNGQVYTIIRENHKYFIKITDRTEFKVSDLDYVGGIKNKMSESYPSYEEALKHLNMKFQQLNEMYGVKGGYNLFEQDIVETEDTENAETGIKEKKYKLKVANDDASSEEPVSEPSPETPETSPEIPSVEDVPASPEGEEPAADMGGEDSMGDDEDDIDIDEDEDPKKYIQKLTGRLGQKLRELSEVDPKLEKYVINSVISALHVDKMDKKDRMDVIKKFKKKKGMESMMKESFNFDESYGMMSLDGPFNYEKMKRGFDENSIESHSKSHRPLRYKKFEVDMDEELHGGQRKLDLNRNGKLDSEDFKMLRSKKRGSSDEWQGLAARAIGSAIGGYVANKMGSDENEKHLNREARIEDAIRRVMSKGKEKNTDEKFDRLSDVKFHGTKDERFNHDMDEMDIEHLFNDGGQNEPEVIDPETDIDTNEPLTPPVPRRANPFDPGDPSNDPMTRPKMKNEPEIDDPDVDIDEPLTPPVPKRPNPFDPSNPIDDPMTRPKMRKDLTFESIIEKYRVKK